MRNVKKHFFDIFRQIFLTFAIVGHICSITTDHCNLIFLLSSPQDALEMEKFIIEKLGVKPVTSQDDYTKVPSFLFIK